MPNAFWCIVEDDRNGSPKKVMAEVIGEAARLAPGRVEAVWLTDKASEAGLKQLGEWGASRVLLLENAAFAPYRSEVWTAAAADLAAKESPAAIFAPVTSRQREFVARLAARLGVGLSADSVRFAMEGDKLVATRPVYAGKLLSKVTWAKSPWVATLRPNVFRPADSQPGKTASVERPTVSAPGAQMKFVVDGIRGTYEGKFTSDASSIEGTWTQRQPLPLVLRRATPETAWKDPASHTIQFVTVDKNDEVKLDGQAVGVDGLEQAVRDLPSTKRSSLALQADKKASFGTIIKVMDKLKLAGVKNLPAFTEGEK